MAEFIFFIIGIIIGVFICKLSQMRNTIGNLRIDQSDPDDDPYIFLETTKVYGVDAIKKMKTVNLNVVVKNYIAQK